MVIKNQLILRDIQIHCDFWACFASTLIRLNLQFGNLKSFGTDGEPDLIKVFKICFPKAIHLRCLNHLRQNIKDKHSLQQGFTEFLHDMFGVQRGNHFEEGLVDAETQAVFVASLDKLKEKWNN